MSFAKQLAEARNSDSIYLVRGGRDHTGRPAWYFVRVESTKQRMFLQHIRSGALDLTGFGEIIESGYGEEPPEAVVAHMKAFHNFAA